ncbi:probable helicase with zinc finger domain [Bacillus rossius redtenbacheri]|uniref:probable helicase with zinc finger domain n=1 Tax=Bacillus rossius redtenbacheri TaxID=93214 RepID=UPI002FDC7F8E
MSELEVQAYELLRRREWFRAAELFDQLLSPVFLKSVSAAKIVCFLLGRAECMHELGQHETVVSDCRHVLKLLGEVHSIGNYGIIARRCLVHSLFALGRFTEAEAVAREWLTTGGGPSNQPEALKMLERLRIVSQMSNPRRSCSEGDSMDNHVGVNSVEHWPEQLSKQRKHPVRLLNDFSEKTSNDNLVQKNHQEVFHREEAMLTGSANYEFHADHAGPGRDANVCSYCCLAFASRADLQAHCQSDGHQTVVMSDEGRDWEWRPPPRGLTADAYTLCEGAPCRYGALCVEAHGPEELAEWRERFRYRSMKVQRAYEKELFGKSYTEQLLERWVQAASPEKIMRESVSGVEETCSDELVTTVASKTSHKQWLFVLKTNKLLRIVALLQDAHRNHFAIKYVSTRDLFRNVLSEWSPSNDQEWSVPAIPGIEQGEEQPAPPYLHHHVKIEFATDIYGTFRQSVVFDFGEEPVLVRHLCVDVVPVTDVDRLKEICKELVISTSERWDAANSDVVPFSSSVTPAIATPEGVAKDGERERGLLGAYPCPRPETFSLTQSSVSEKKLTRNNYRARMHELLCVEEMARYEQVARYNLTAKLRLADCYLLAPNGIATSTAKYAHLGELFALINLGKDISEDTSAGRLILTNCTSVLLADSNVSLNSGSSQGQLSDGTRSRPGRVVYEALIEDKGKNMIYLRLSATTVKDLRLEPDTDFVAEVQFQLNRIPYCEWHYAIDKIADFRVVFPDTYLEPSIPWTPQRQWSEILDSRLNLKQKEAVVAITTPVNCPLPPILIIGPFGTGKTYTLAQAIKQLLIQPKARVLVCTHSNSAADLYIKEYLHPYVEEGHEEARPLRIYYHKRWVATVNQVVQKYCLIEVVGGMRTFCVPTLEDVLKHRIIVVTLSISMYLSSLGLPKGHFTHILLDEAAQAMECEAIMPLALANDDTRIVLAGDHMQLSPELFSQFAKERNLHVSLLERLYDHYPSTFPCKILLCENYRAHDAIIQFTSELFYDQKLVSSGNQPRHEKFYPLTFFTARGEDVQDVNSTAFYNNAEVYEVVERVCELRKRWPPVWGKLDDQSIGIMTPYSDQVFRIRSELRKRRMGGISVERVLNVQGKQFRAIFLSTVRTRRTCHSGTKPGAGGDEMDYGFLSNSKLLNTAITRAQSLVAVVGDPVALCSIGRCRKVWERFIEICDQNKSLFGITWLYLRSQLDGVELKKTYVLNPLAPEFVPRRYLAESYINLPPPLLAPGVAPPPPFRLPPAPFPPCVYPFPPVYYCRPPPPPPPPPPLPFNPWALNYPLVSPGGWQAAAVAVLASPGEKRPAAEGGSAPEAPGDPPGFAAARPCADKPEQIQFLRNVHFPEKLPPLSQLFMNGHGPPRPAVVPPSLPVPQSKQLEWSHLADASGVEAATKFMELLSLGSADGQAKLAQVPASRAAPSSGRLPPHCDESFPARPPQGSAKDDALWRGAAGGAEDLPREARRSAPLYRRQPQCDGSGAGSSSSGAFAGYARAAVGSLRPAAAGDAGGSATYASVLRADPRRAPDQDPFVVLRALGSKGMQGASGLYHHFS